MKKIFFALTVLRHGCRCFNALAEVFAKQKLLWLILAWTLILASCATTKANPDEVSLNTAIRQAAARMESGLNAGTKIALINFTSPSQAFSDYVLDELSAVLVNNGQ